MDKEWITELNADMDDDAWFRQRFLCEVPEWQPRRRPCGFCHDEKQEDENHHWTCLNPECKSHEMARRVDAELIRMYGTATPISDARRERK